MRLHQSQAHGWLRLRCLASSDSWLWPGKGQHESTWGKKKKKKKVHGFLAIRMKSSSSIPVFQWNTNNTSGSVEPDHPSQGSHSLEFTSSPFLLLTFITVSCLSTTFSNQRNVAEGSDNYHWNRDADPARDPTGMPSGPGAIPARRGLPTSAPYSFWTAHGLQRKTQAPSTAIYFK